MNLQEFVTTTLNEIMNGIREAQDSDLDQSLKDRTGEEPGEINPSYRRVGGASNQPTYQSHRDEYIHFVEFDIAVVAEESAEAKVGSWRRWRAI